MAGIKNVPRVRVEGQERLDLPDFNAIMELMDESIQSQIGAVMGRGGGCLSPFQFTLEDDGVNYWIRPGAFQYYWSKRDKTAPDGTYRRWKGGVGTFDPTAEGQSTLIDYTAAKALGVAAYLYVRPKTVDTATDARRKWSAGAETSVSLKTRTNVVQEWIIRTTIPTDIENDGWAPVLYITDWNAVTNAAMSMVWDSLDAYAVAEQGTYGGDPTSVQLLATLMNNGTDGTASGINDFDGGASTDRSMGVIQMLTQFRDRFFRHLDKTGATKWYADPTRDLKQLNTDLLLTDVDVAALDARVVTLEGVKRFSWFIESSGVNYTPISFQSGAADATGNTPNLNRVSVGVVDFKFFGGAGLVLQGIVVQPANRAIGPVNADRTSIAVSPAPGWEYRIGLQEGGIMVDSSFFLSLDYRVP